jgi:hypothetical protein
MDITSGHTHTVNLYVKFPTAQRWRMLLFKLHKPISVLDGAKVSPSNCTALQSV